MNEHRRLELALLCVLTLLAAWLRFRQLGVPSLWLDELLNVDIARKATSYPLASWLGGFEKENGPFYFLTLVLGLTFLDDVELAARVAGAIAGVVSVPLIFHAARRLFPAAHFTPLLAAFLLAISPLHVYYSRDARTYPWLVLATILILGSLARIESRRDRGVFTIAALVTAYIAATAAPILLVSAAALSALLAFRRDRKLVVPLLATLLSAAAIAFLYLRHSAPASYELAKETLAGNLLRILSGFTTSAIEHATPEAWTLVALPFFALIGAVVAFRRERASAALLTLYFVGLVTVTLVALRVVHHWFSVRYVLFALPPFLLLAARGIEWVGELVRVRSVAVAAIGLAVLTSHFPAALSEPLDRADWRAVMSLVDERAQEGDVLLASNAWTSAAVRFYRDELQSSVRVHGAEESRTGAEIFFQSQTPKWLLSGGFHDDESVPEWMCRFDLLAAQQHESIKLHFAPGIAEFLAATATARDRRRAARLFYDGMNATLTFSRADRIFLGHGWFDAEEGEGREFRWCEKNARIVLPARANPSDLLFMISSAPDDQELRVTIDGRVVPAITVAPQRAMYRIVLPSPRAEMYDIRFDFARDEVPGGGDDRRLAAAFDELHVVARGGSPPSSAFAAVYRIEDFHPKSSWWKRGFEYERGAIRALLFRCSIDETDHAAVAVSASTLAQLLEDRVAHRPCASDEDFLRLAFQLIYGRRIDGESLRHYARQLRSGIRRDRIIRRMMRTAEFRQMYGFTLE